ncbi:MAG: type II secretion system protein [Candidatus Gastranaerophilaceae bacterium]
MLNKTTKLGFTLAEVLLTLTIIGIIAAMTIPALINNTNKMENVVALKKAYSTIMQATLMLTADYGGDITGIMSGVANNDDFANVFVPKLNVAKICGATNANATGCFPNEIYKHLDGTDWNNINTDTAYSKFLINDQMSYAFVFASTSCMSDQRKALEPVSSPLYSVCGSFYVDINGPNKGPATLGRDLFVFYVTKKGIYPVGAYPDMWNSDCLPTGGGGCANKVLLEGAMNY